MRISLALTATVLALASSAPASAQMCGGQTTGSSASASTPTSGGGMMCGMGQRAATDPMAEPSQPAQSQRTSAGCPCCRNMAMMQGGMQGGMGGRMGSGGAQAPAQQPTQPSMPATPSMPGMPGMTPR
jgi:hypothetical protein